MKRKIISYEQEPSSSHWLALLDCGHKQHLRHDPPWMNREWVLSEEGRRRFLGSELECKRCDEEQSS